MSVTSLIRTCVGFAFFAFLLMFVNAQNTSEIYREVWVLPLAFVPIGILLSAVRPLSENYTYTVTFFFFLFFVRLVVSPLSIHLAGPYYTAVAYFVVTSEEIFRATLLIAWESLAAAIFLFIILTSRDRMESSRTPRYVPQIRLLGSKIFYCFIVLLGLALLIGIGIPRGLINFGGIASSGILTERTPFDMILIQLMMAAAWLTFLLVTVRQASHLRRRASLRSFLISLVVGMLLLMLIFGDRRSVQVYTGVAIISTFFIAFPNRKKMTVAAILTTMVSVVVTISIWRMFTRHGLDMSTALVSQDSLMPIIATAFQSYFGGPYHIAAENSLLSGANVGLENILFDFLRSLFGLNFFVDKNGLLTSQTMNLSLYNNEFDTGWLVFSTSYGYVALGIFLMPVWLMLNIFIAMWLEKKFRRTRGLEFKFLFVYLFVRMAFTPFTATPFLLSFLSMQLLTIGFIFFFGALVKDFDRPFLRAVSFSPNVSAVKKVVN